jgi:hypothetical protein
MRSASTVLAQPGAPDVLCEPRRVETSLDGMRVKLARARRHVDELKAILGSVADDAVASINGQPSGTNPSVLEYRVMRVPPLDPVASAVVGDIVHNLRSALDHLAWQLVLLDPATDAMGIMQRLDNIDKHRLLLTVIHRIDLDLPAYWGSSDGDPVPRGNCVSGRALTAVRRVA